jgi:hypothetical protein
LILLAASPDPPATALCAGAAERAGPSPASEVFPATVGEPAEKVTQNKFNKLLQLRHGSINDTKYNLTTGRITDPAKKENLRNKIDRIVTKT